MNVTDAASGRDGTGLNAAVLGMALDSAGVPVIITEAKLDPPGPAIRFINASFERMTGYAAGELIGHTPRILQGPETDRATLNMLKQALRDEKRFTGEAMNYRKDGSRYEVEWIITPLVDGASRVAYWLSVQRDLSAREERESTLLAHHTRGLLARVGSIAARTLRGSNEAERLQRRLQALSRVHGGPGQGANAQDVEMIVRTEIEALGADNGRVSIVGNRMTLPPAMTEAFAMAVHELAQNSRHYGALSAYCPQGRLAVRWHTTTGSIPRLEFEWTESGVQVSAGAAMRSGFGRDVLEAALPFAFGGTAEWRPGADGVEYRASLPLRGG